MSDEIVVTGDGKGGMPRRLPSYVPGRLRAQCYRLLAGLLQSGVRLGDAARYAVDLAEQQKKLGMPSMDQVTMGDFLGVFSGEGKEEINASLARVSLPEQILLRRIFTPPEFYPALSPAASSALLMRAAEILEADVLFASLDRPALSTGIVAKVISEPNLD